MGMGQTIVFAVLPPIAREIGLADFQVGAVFMLSAMFWVMMGPRWGRLSDHRGRRLFILIGIGGFAVSMALFATAIRLGLNGALSGFGLYVIILLTRSIYGIIGSAQPSAAQAYIADRTTPENRAKGLASFAAAFGFGTMLGPAFARRHCRLWPAGAALRRCRSRNIGLACGVFLSPGKQSAAGTRAAATLEDD